MAVPLCICLAVERIGRGSNSESRFELAMHKSGTTGRDITCCGVEAPKRPASRCCRGQFVCVTCRVITTGEYTSRVSISMEDPAGSSASGMSRGGDSSIRLPSEDPSSQSATASRICVRNDFGWTDVTNDVSNNICSWSTAALKNLRKGACSGLLVTMYEFLNSWPDRRAKARSIRMAWVVCQRVSKNVRLPNHLMPYCRRHS